MSSFQNFRLYYAKSLTENEPDDADLFIDNTGGVSLLSCIPSEFSKRQTDTSNALAVDKTSPDSGTAADMVQLRIAIQRETAPSKSILKVLMQMFYLKTDDDDFRKARFGLTNTDNPELDVEPTANGGYKFIGFKQEPNQDTPGLIVYVIDLDYIGDHNLLGAFP